MRRWGDNSRQQGVVVIMFEDSLEFVLEKGTVGDLSLVLGMLGQQCWGLS